jgi:hypothetical protein
MNFSPSAHCPVPYLAALSCCWTFCPFSKLLDTAHGHPCRCLPACPPGELQEPSKKAIARLVEAQDQLVENAKNGTEGEGQRMS